MGGSGRGITEVIAPPLKRQSHRYYIGFYIFYIGFYRYVDIIIVNLFGVFASLETVFSVVDHL